MTKVLNRWRWMWSVLAVLSAWMMISIVASGFDSSAFFGWTAAVIGYTTLAVIGWDAHLDLQQVES